MESVKSGNLTHITEVPAYQECYESVNEDLYDDVGFLLDDVEDAYDWVIAEWDIDPCCPEDCKFAREKAREISKEAAKLVEHAKKYKEMVIAEDR